MPADYNISRATNKRYPALYLLDGGLELAIVHPIVGAGGFGPAAGVSADVILVGVGRAEGQAQKRDRDYTLPQPGDSSYENARSADGSPRFGGAASFLRVLKEEVIPLIDRTYRTNGDRGIHGQSLGGYFVAYAMFEAPDLFNRYAMTSPALQWGHGDMLKREPAFAGQHPTFAKRIFLSVGSDEYPMMASVMWQFASQLCDSFSRRTYKGMHLIAESIAGEPHGSPVHHLHAMRALYPADSTKPMLPGAVRDCEP